MKFQTIKFITIVSCFGITLCGCEHKNNNSDNLRSVILVSPTPVAASESKDYSGVIEEGKSVNASFMADGKVSKILVKEGDRVRKGQLLATLDDTDYQIGVNQLRAQFNQMTEEKKRMDEMFNRHNIAPNDYEKFSAGYEQLKLQMDMAENKLGYTRLYSPSEGYVAEKLMEPGELVGAGTPIVKITDDSNLTVNIDLPVSVFLNKDKINEAFGFSPAIPDTSIPLNLLSLTPDASNNMIYQMKLSIPSRYNSILTPGMNMRVTLRMNESHKEGNMIPARAILDDNGKNYVWIFNPKDSTIHKKSITVVGSQIDNEITVMGLEENEKIVETGVKQLYEGEKVNVVNKADFRL